MCSATSAGMVSPSHSAEMYSAVSPQFILNLLASSVCVPNRPQSFARRKQPRTYCSERNVEDIRQFLIGLSFNLTQPDELSLFVRKSRDGVLKKRRHLAVAYTALLERFRRCALPLSPPIGDVLARYPEEPITKSTELWIVPLRSFPKFCKCLLNDVLGGLYIARHPPGECVQPRRLRMIKSVEGVQIARTNLFPHVHVAGHFALHMYIRAGSPESSECLGEIV